MIVDLLDSKILEATKEGNQQKKEALRALKNAFLQYKTAKNAKPLDNAAEISILKKLISEREDAALIYSQYNRIDLADIEMEQAKYLKEFMPRIPSRSDLEIVLIGMYDSANPKIDKKDMGNVIKKLKEAYPAADGKMIADIVKSHTV